MFSHVLVPTDGSESSRQAVEQAVSIVLTYGATVHALYGRDESAVPNVPDGGSDRDWGLSELDETAASAFRQVTGRCDEASVPAPTTIETGRPVDRILTYATANDIDLDVVGTHPRPAGPLPPDERGRTGLPGGGDSRARGERQCHDEHPPLPSNLPTDGLVDARRAEHRAFDLAGAYGAVLHVLYVVDTQSASQGRFTTCSNRRARPSSVS